MGALTALMTLAEIAGPALQLTQKGIDIYGQIQDLKASGHEPTAADWDKLNAHLRDLKAQLDKDP